MPRFNRDLAAALAAVALGTVVVFREEPAILGVPVPHCTGLVFAFTGGVRLFYLLYSQR
jgi:hypothetical protein